MRVNALALPNGEAVKKPCTICNVVYDEKGCGKTCSPVCRKEHYRRYTVAASRKKREEIRKKAASSPLVPCACGCGKRIRSIGKTGMPLRYIHRHGPTDRFTKPITRQETKPCGMCGSLFTAPMANDRKFCSPICYFVSIRGSDNLNWNGGTTKIGIDERHKAFITRRYRKWRRSVLERDGNRCVRCSAVGELHAHHINAWVDHPDLRYHISNGETLCAPCHWKEEAERRKVWHRRRRERRSCV